MVLAIKVPFTEFTVTITPGNGFPLSHLVTLPTILMILLLFKPVFVLLVRLLEEMIWLTEVRFVVLLVTSAAAEVPVKDIITRKIIVKKIFLYIYPAPPISWNNILKIIIYMWIW